MKPRSWWFASTAIPLFAATIGPLANVLSIAALVTSWRAQLGDNGELPGGADELGVGIADPHWLVGARAVVERTIANRFREILLNAVSLACGFAGNFFLLCNFTKRVRYIISLPMSIIFWFFATGIVCCYSRRIDSY
jgi:potassium channel subfamily K, other eukaryote